MLEPIFIMNIQSGKISDTNKNEYFDNGAAGFITFIHVFLN